MFLFIVSHRDYSLHYDDLCNAGKVSYNFSHFDFSNNYVDIDLLKDPTISVAHSRRRTHRSLPVKYAGALFFLREKI